MFLLLLVACGPPPAPGSDSAQPADSGYPAPAAVEEPTPAAYPGPRQVSAPTPVTGYPAPDAEPAVSAEYIFRIDRPLAADGTLVTGQAPPNLPLAVIDITFNGTLLGTDVSGDDGRFEIPVSPLPDGHHIGVAISGPVRGLSFQETLDEYFPYRGTGFINIPNIGVVFDSAVVGQ